MRYVELSFGRNQSLLFVLDDSISNEVKFSINFCNFFLLISFIKVLHYLLFLISILIFDLKKCSILLDAIGNASLRHYHEILIDRL